FEFEQTHRLNLEQAAVGMVQKYPGEEKVEKGYEKMQLQRTPARVTEQTGLTVPPLQVPESPPGDCTLNSMP
ncbi:hypothetical protein HAX54_042039, partial [Datura stramonium]|nr:hypothetical protein [Datura stramonium]